MRAFPARVKTILHLVNPVTVADPASDLRAAQPVTFAAMTEASAFAAATGRAAVGLCAAVFPEDHDAVPTGFHRAPDLTRSVLDVSRFARARKLPLLTDLVARALDAADRFGADWIVYTNVDIAPTPDFYTAIARLIDHGGDAFTINRRTIARDWPGGVPDLPLMRARVGTAHPGRDCFVFAREAARAYDCGLACIGAKEVGKVLAANLLAHARRFEEHTDLHVSFHLGDDRAWLAPEMNDFTAHNQRELAAVMDRLRAAGLGSAHPLWQSITDFCAKLADPPAR